MIVDYVDSRPVPRYLIYDIIKFDVSCVLYTVRCLTGDTTEFTNKKNVFIKFREMSGECVLACGQLPRVLFLAQNMQNMRVLY